MTPLAVLQQVPRGDSLVVSGDTLMGAQDTLAAAVGTVRDTLGKVPLPGGVAAVMRFLFQVPQWIQIGGAFLGLAVGTALVILVWRRRRAILHWLVTRSREIQIGLALAVVGLVAAAGWAGYRSWHYIQHDNDFCTGCHIMERPFQLFQGRAAKHAELSCHDCHQQSIWASARQLVLWVAERPEKIGPHAPVPDQRCESCHQVERGRERWQHAHWLAGHRVHFESDSAALEGLKCVTCHGAEVHKFVPSARTCQQSGCHEQQPIRLFHQAKVPELNCVTCHNFKADLPALATRDSAVRALVPAEAQCLTCHQMEGRPAGFDLARDPHRGVCGFCHNVHQDSVAAAAGASCRSCHTDLTRSAFHTGASHRRVLDQCLVCHQPHAASADPSDCVGCHTEVQRRGLRRPPLPFDTAAVLRRRRIPPPDTGLGFDARARPVIPERGLGRLGGPHPAEEASELDVRWATVARYAPPDSFSHNRHASLACLTCHRIDLAGQARGLTFEVPRGCNLCHHQQIVAGRVEASECARCHRQERAGEARPVSVAVRVPDRPPALRTVGFQHARHRSLACADCHRPPEPAPPDSVRTCAACHAPHHAEGRECTACHNRSETSPAHVRADHVECDACHTAERIAPLVPVRNFCLTCHQRERDHEAGRECTVCHLLQTPEEFRRYLTRAAGE